MQRSSYVTGQDKNLDPATISIATLFFQSLLAVTCVLAWVQEPRDHLLRWLSVGSVLVCIGISLQLQILGSTRVGIEFGNAFLLAGQGAILMSCAALAGRRIRKRAVLIGALMWIVACELPIFADVAMARVIFFSLISGCYAGMAGTVLLRMREKVRARWPAICIGYVLVLFLAARAALAPWTPFPFGGLEVNGPHPAWFAILPAVALTYLMITSFSLISGTRERMELRHRLAAMLDGLTGVANRQAFLDRARQHLRARGRRPNPTMSLVIFDLDLFKQINDRFGHPTGDRALVLFTRTATAVFGKHVEFGRIGGEEFAALVHCDEQQTVRLAERVRAAFLAASRLSLPDMATFSAGVCELEAGYTLEVALERADLALYRAKRAGRNCVGLIEREIAVAELAPAAA